MTEPADYERYRIWFNRVGRGIALVGPSILLLIILATFVTRLFTPADEAARKSETSIAPEKGAGSMPAPGDSASTVSLERASDPE